MYPAATRSQRPLLRLTVGGAIIIAALALVACARIGSASPSAPSATATRPAVSIPAALQGTWMANVSGTTASSGAWTLIITADDMQLKNPLGTESFSIHPLDVTDSSFGLGADADCPTDGSYSYSLSGDTLVITAVADSCSGRMGVMTTGEWTR